MDSQLGQEGKHFPHTQVVERESGVPAVLDSGTSTAWGSGASGFQWINATEAHPHWAAGRKEGGGFTSSKFVQFAAPEACFIFTPPCVSPRPPACPAPLRRAAQPRTSTQCSMMPTAPPSSPTWPGPSSAGCLPRPKFSNSPSHTVIFWDSLTPRSFFD